MKKKAVILIIIVFFICDVSQAVKEILKDESQIKGDGAYNVYLPGQEGKAYSKGNYKSKQKEGRHESFDVKTGKLLEQCQYFVGEKHGICKQYYSSNGNLYIIGDFVAGVPHGQLKEYYPNGQLKKESRYNSGSKHGRERIFNEKGRIIFEFEYKMDTKIKGKKFGPNGEVIAQGLDISE